MDKTFIVKTYQIIFMVILLLLLHYSYKQNAMTVHLKKLSQFI